ncbi:hypothetical protein FQN57_007393 [Myotisia sp. PD_48]|nr:hypothetical protein FQN57_007393 [Myotisia sp. PD_48]
MCRRRQAQPSYDSDSEVSLCVMGSLQSYTDPETDLETDVTNTDLSDDGDSSTPTKISHLPPKRSGELSKAVERTLSLESESDLSESDDPDDETDNDISSNDDDGYADSSRLQIDKAGEMWKRFCRAKQKRNPSDLRWKDPEKALRLVDYKLTYRFFNWRLKLKKGKGGRRLRGIKKVSAIETPWKNFLRYYERSTHRKLDKKTIRKWKKVKGRLEQKFNLDNQEQEKTPMYIEDLVDLQGAILKSFKKRFYIGLQRMQVCLYNLLACFTVNRPSALLHLQYKHLKISLQRDPHGGRPRITIGTKYSFTKRFLGMKQLNTFIFPEIIHDPSLLMSVHTFFLGILLHDDAFQPRNLKSMDDIQRLWVGEGRQQMKIPLKASKEENYVFSSQLRVFGEILGYLKVVFARRYRYGGGEMINESGISEAKQNLIMNHADIRTFLKHYLPRDIHQLDCVMRGIAIDSKLKRAMSRMGASIDTRRPRDVPDELKATLDTDPEIQKALLKLKDFETRADPSSKTYEKKHDQLKKDIRNARKRRLYELRRQVREEFDDKQAVIDIEHQLSGKAMDEEAREGLEEELPPKLVDLLETLMTWPTSWDVEVEWRRRNASVEAVRTYCSVLEGGPRRGRQPQKRVAADPLPKVDTKRIRVEVPPPMSEAERAREHILEAEQLPQERPPPRACLHCLKFYKGHRRAQATPTKPYAESAPDTNMIVDVEVGDGDC